MLATRGADDFTALGPASLVARSSYPVYAVRYDQG